MIFDNIFLAIILSISLAPLALKSAAFTDEMLKIKSKPEKHLPALFHYLDKFIGLAVEDDKDKLFGKEVDFINLLHTLTI